MKRIDLLKEISKHYFSYSPVISGGWGFIGDSWAVETPLIVTHNDYCLQENREALVTPVNEIHNAITKIYANDELYRQLKS